MKRKQCDIVVHNSIKANRKQERKKEREQKKKGIAREGGKEVEQRKK